MINIRISFLTAGAAVAFGLLLTPLAHAQRLSPAATIIIPSSGGPLQALQPDQRRGRGGGGRGGGGGGRGGRGGGNGNGNGGGNYPQNNTQNGTGGGTGTGRTSTPLKFTPGTVVSSAPVSGNGMLYLSSSNNKLYALDAKTGQSKWSFTAAQIINSSPALGPDGTVYVGAYDHILYALDGQTGKQKWQFTTGDILASAPVVNKSMVYVGGKDHVLYALDAATGTSKWQVKTGAAVSGPITGPDGTVYAGANGIYAVDGQTGKVKWTQPTVTDPEAPVALGPDGTLYAGTHGGQLYALDSVTGHIRWTAQITGDILYPPTVTDTAVYVGGDKLYALRPSDGRALWQYGDATAVWSTPAVSPNGTVYVGNSNQTVMSLNGARGTMGWSFDTGDPFLSFPTIGTDGMLIVSSAAEGKVYALNSRSGKTLWQFPPATAAQ